MSRSTPCCKPYCSCCKKKYWREAMHGSPSHFAVRAIGVNGRTVTLRCDNCSHEYKSTSKAARRHGRNLTPT